MTKRRHRNVKTIHKWNLFFSNFYVEPDGTHVEGEFQAEKHFGHPIRQHIIRKSTPKVPSVWPALEALQLPVDGVGQPQAQVMHELVKRKIDDHPAHPLRACRF